jgi:hypothetical protein
MMRCALSAPGGSLFHCAQFEAMRPNRRSMRTKFVFVAVAESARQRLCNGESGEG